jgi:macrodomain Ter protein organizer (MatP/YcbG family)
MALVHKSVDVRLEVWRKLRLNAELSGVPLRDYLSYLIERSRPVLEGDAEAMAALRQTSQANVAALADATLIS